MRQPEEQKKKRGGRRRANRRALVVRRAVAGVLVVLAVVLGVLIFKTELSPAKLMWGVACALLLVEALLLSVNLRASKALQGLIAVLVVLLLGLGFLIQNYARVDGRLVPKYALLKHIQVTDRYPEHFDRMQSLETLDMRGSTVTDFEPIKALTGLRHVDLRDNYAFDEARHDDLAAALPGCDIRWSIPITGSHFDSAATAVDLTAMPLSNAELRTLIARYPEKRFTYGVNLMGHRFSQNVTELSLGGEAPDAAALDDALSLLKAVTVVDLRGVPASAQTVAALCDSYPNIHFMFTCDVPNGTMTTEDAHVTVQGGYDDLLAYTAYLDYMPNLQVMDASAIPMSTEQVDAIRAGAHTDKLLYSLRVFGVPAGSMDTELNLDNMPVTSVEAMEEYIARLPNLKKISMCGCGLSEEQMGRLFDAHPEIKFVWWIEFGHYRLRTDATAFTTGLGDGNKFGYNDSTFAPIRYCTDLRMLDLGHNRITSMENFRGLKELRVLILADNKLTDISPIADLENLEYVELFLNDIKDVTPLTGLKHLMDLNLYYNPLYENHKVLGSMIWLDRLWIGGCRLSDKDVKALRQALPNTRINVTGRSSTGEGWREHSHYYTLKQMYEEERYIPFD